MFIVSTEISLGYSCAETVFGYLGTVLILYRPDENIKKYSALSINLQPTFSSNILPIYTFYILPSKEYS